MLKGIIQDQSLESHKGRVLHNHLRPTQYNYNETTTNTSYDFNKPVSTDWNKIMNMGNKLNNPLPPSNVYVGAKNIYPLMEEKRITGLEMFQSGKNNDNVLPFKDTFSNKKYYTYI